MTKYGSLTINTIGDIIPCTGDPNKRISLKEALMDKDTKWLVRLISSSIREIQVQSCPIFIKH